MATWIPVTLCALALAGCDPFGGDESAESPPPSGSGGQLTLGADDRCRSKRIALHPEYRSALVPVVRQLFREQADARISVSGTLKAMKALIGVCSEQRGITYAEAVEQILRTVEDADIFR